MRVGLASRRKERPACSDEPGVAVFVEDDVPFAALECVECEVYLVDGKIGYAARSQDDDLLSLLSPTAGHQADELGVARDGELQIPADVASDLARAGRELVRRHRSARDAPYQVLSKLLRRSEFSSASSCW